MWNGDLPVTQTAEMSGVAIRTSYFRHVEGPIGFGYARSSTNKQELSTAVQDSEIRKAAGGMSFPFGTTYADDYVSGFKVPFKERREARKLLMILRAGDHVFVWKLDRFGRSLKDIVEVLDFLTKHEVNIHVLQHGAMRLDLNSTMGKLIVGILAVFAEFERDLIRDRTREALRYRKEHGLVYCRRTNWGKKKIYTPGPEGGKGSYRWVTDPEQLELARKAYMMNKTMGTGLRKMVRMWRTLGYRTPDGGNWGNDSLRAVIKWYAQQMAEGKVV